MLPCTLRKKVSKISSSLPPHKTSQSLCLSVCLSSLSQQLASDPHMHRCNMVASSAPFPSALRVPCSSLPSADPQPPRLGLQRSTGFLKETKARRRSQCGGARRTWQDPIRTAIYASSSSSTNVSIQSDGSSSLVMNHYQALEASNTAKARLPDDDSDVLIELRNVYKSFGENHILKGISLKVHHGEAMGIIGPSGTGKSTVLRIMAGLLAPDKGDVYICGKKHDGLISDEGMLGLHIGLVFQSAALFDSLTVRENVGFMLYEHSFLSQDKISELVTESLAAVGLKGVEDYFPSELSGGMKKRVALARAIISDNTQKEREPEVVMYDEPTAGLDPIASTVVEDLIRSVHIKGRDASGQPGKVSSYVVVTHQNSTIRRAVDRLLFLHDGRIVWEGTIQEFDTTSNSIVRQFAEGSLQGPISY